MAMSKKFKAIHQQHGLYEDPYFWPHISLLAKDPERDLTKVEWLRPLQITPDAKFCVDGFKYFDYEQEELGNCWFIAAVVSIVESKHKDLLKRVVPDNQSFDKNYSGAFRFNFWRFGRWVEVIIDDRLPTADGQLIYGQNRSVPNEFWPALLEKAYAKFKGSYQAIDGWEPCVAFVDMTGCIAEYVVPSEVKLEELGQKLLKAIKKNTVVCCGTGEYKEKREKFLEDIMGLPTGHSYSVFDVIQVDVDNKPVTLLHLRNPWGEKTEWMGPWRDYSKEWEKYLTAEQRAATTRKTIRDPRYKNSKSEDSGEGEFWISLEQIHKIFSDVQFCHLPPTTQTEEIANNHGLSPWKVSEFVGTIKVGDDPPHFDLPLRHADGPTKVIIQLLVANVHEWEDKAEFGVLIYKKKPDGTREEDHIAVARDASNSASSIFENLEPGDYIIQPGYHEDSKKCEVQFYLRVFTEN